MKSKEIKYKMTNERLKKQVIHFNKIEDLE